MNAIKTSGENYLETIYELSQTNDKVRSIDIATTLSVSRPSVNKAMGVLQEAGMIVKEPYGDIILTAEGSLLAREIHDRHALLRRFLVDVLGVSPAIAEDDACKMEHVMSKTAIAKLAVFIKDLA